MSVSGLSAQNSEWAVEDFRDGYYVWIVTRDVLSWALCCSEYKLVISDNQIAQHSDLGRAKHSVFQNIW